MKSLAKELLRKHSTALGLTLPHSALICSYCSHEFSSKNLLTSTFALSIYTHLRMVLLIHLRLSLVFLLLGLDILRLFEHAPCGISCLVVFVRIESFHLYFVFVCLFHFVVVV